MLELFATTHCEKRTISLLSRVPIFTCPKMGVVNTQIQTETTFITAKPEKWLTFFVVVAEIVFICMDTSHVKRKIDSQNFVIFSDTNTPLLYLQKDYMLTGIYLYIMLLWRLNCIVFFCFVFFVQNYAFSNSVPWLRLRGPGVRKYWRGSELLTITIDLHNIRGRILREKC